MIKGACAHSFCRECLLRVLETKRECPKCKATPIARGGTVESLLLRNTDMCAVVESQLVHCPCGVLQIDGQWSADPGGCPAVVPLGELERHVAACAHTPAECLMVRHGCGWRGQANTRAAHEASCAFVHSLMPSRRVLN